MGLNYREGFIEYMLQTLKIGVVNNYKNAIEGEKFNDLVKKYCDPNFTLIYNISDHSIIQSWLDILLQKDDFIRYNKSRNNGGPRAAMRKYIKFLMEEVEL